ncbi:MAG: hypothetical protein Q7S75_00985 [bacterium]|nr:hypothetical protein [bacterium]
MSNIRAGPRTVRAQNGFAISVRVVLTDIALMAGQDGFGVGRCAGDQEQGFAGNSDRAGTP